MILNTLFNEYLCLIEPLQTEHTIVVKKSFYKKYIKDLFGNRELETIKKNDVQIWINNLQSVGLKPKTIKNIKDVLHVLYNVAVKLSYVDFNPVLDVEFPICNNQERILYSLDVQKKIVDAVISFREPIYKDIFIFLLQGTRIKDILSIKWSMIDMKQKKYYIVIKINKVKKTKEYLMDDVLFDILSRLYKKDFIELRNSLSESYVFRSPRTNTKFVNIGKAWERLLFNANLFNIKIKDLKYLSEVYRKNFSNIRKKLIP